MQGLRLRSHATVAAPFARAPSSGAPCLTSMTSAAQTSAPTAVHPDLRAKADAVFERVSPYEGFGFRHHCQRLWRFTTMLLEQRGLTLDPDVAYMVAMWHDLGLVSERDQGANYLRRSLSLFQRESKDVDLQGSDPAVLQQCLLYNHRLLPVPNLAPEAECFRRAVIIEHSRGLKRWGLDRGAVKQVFDELPRGNFDRVLLDFTWRTFKREPLSVFNGIFFGPSPTVGQAA